MANHQIGAGFIYALATITVDKGATSGGYCNIKTWRITHNASVDRIKAQTGLTQGIIGNDEMIEVSIDYIPSSLTLSGGKALAATNASLPEIPSFVTIAGAPVIAIGPFANGLNSADFVYEGGGTINGIDDSHWTASFVLRRYIGIVAGAVVS